MRISDWSSDVCSSDLINRLRIRRQLIRQREETRHLRAVDEMKMRFFSNITHEFRTPLSLIIAPLEEINQDKKTPDSIRKKTTRIQDNAGALLGLINQLLDMSKIEAGHMRVSLFRGDSSEEHTSEHQSPMRLP